MARSAYYKARNRVVEDSDDEEPTSTKTQAGDEFPASTETRALDELMKVYLGDSDDRRSTSQDEEDYVGFDLTDFTIYRRSKAPAKQMRHLYDLKPGKWINELFFDGMISYKNVKHQVKGVKFEIMAIEGYDDATRDGISGMFLQTTACKRRNVWLRLGQPSADYYAYHVSNLWVANFGKFFVDYLDAHKSVTLRHFKHQFYDWLLDRHGESARFRLWAAALKSNKKGMAKHRPDFRVAFGRYSPWLWRESANDNVDLKGTLKKHPIWKEADSNPKWLTAIKKQRSPLTEDSPTIVTPFVYECFRKTYFGDRLKSQKITDKATQNAQQERRRALGFVDESSGTNGAKLPGRGKARRQVSISKGSVIGIARDEQGPWTSRGDIWYLYVTDVGRDHDGAFYQGIWMYAAQDTTIGTAYYPHENELFMSDKCNCHAEASGRIRPGEVMSRPEIDWSPKEISTAGRFVRMTYRPDACTFRTLQDGDLECPCSHSRDDAFDDAISKYTVHGTVLVTTTGSDLLEPFVIEQFNASTKTVTVRALLRAKNCHDRDTMANELVWTSEFYNIRAHQIKRKCHIRFYTPGDPAATNYVPTLYERNGQGDCFVITEVLEASGGGGPTPLDKPYVQLMEEGPDFNLPPEARLRALSLFCGGGNFDRAVQEGGAAWVRWAVDMDVNACHTYRANEADDLDTEIFLGLVDEMLRRALAGETSSVVPGIGLVDLLLAGSPCQGFSNLQSDPNGQRSQTNASKVATVASFVDLWRPKYAILENVPAMNRPRKEGKGESVFAQLIGCIVGMGYQVQQFLMNASSYGDCQRRERLITIAVAPGLPLLSEPDRTHSDPDHVSNVSIGKTPDGLTFGRRNNDKTPFAQVSAQEGTANIPNIGDGRGPDEIAFLDHRCAGATSELQTHIISAIPKSPSGQGLPSIADRHDLPDAVAEWMKTQNPQRLKKGSHAYQRVDGQGLFSAVLTGPRPADFKAGAVCHWNQDRVISVLEARRAQGFPDEEPIIGSITTQYKIIGNSVSRAVGVALGLKLREAWLLVSDQERAPQLAAPVEIKAKPEVASLKNEMSQAQSTGASATLQPRDLDLARAARENGRRLRRELLINTDHSTPQHVSTTSVTIRNETHSPRSHPPDPSPRLIVESQGRETSVMIVNSPGIQQSSFAIRMSQTPVPPSPRAPQGAVKRKLVIELEEEEDAPIGATADVRPAKMAKLEPTDGGTRTQKMEPTNGGKKPKVPLFTWKPRSKSEPIDGERATRRTSPSVVMVSPELPDTAMTKDSAKPKVPPHTSKPRPDPIDVERSTRQKSPSVVIASPKLQVPEASKAPKRKREEVVVIEDSDDDEVIFVGMRPRRKMGRLANGRVYNYYDDEV